MGSGGKSTCGLEENWMEHIHWRLSSEPGWGPLLTVPGGGGGNEEKGGMEGSGLGQST